MSSEVNTSKSELPHHASGDMDQASLQKFVGQQRFLAESHFTAVAGNHNSTITVNPPSMVKRYGLELLLANIAQGAFHDSAERGDPPKCHPHTRVAILNELKQWIEDTHTRQQFITWMYGPAGSGKTAIAQSIAEACAKEHLLAASFFFGRTAAGRNTLIHFVTTLAYQLCKSIPEIENPILTAIEKDPIIFSRSLSTQIQVLVINPLTSVQLTSPSKVVVVDGVDECGPNTQAHTELLKVLAAAVDALKNVPILFLISSRPEYEIRTAFSKSPLTLLTKSLVLDNNYKPDKDIKTYFESKFNEIRQEHLPLLSEPWPPTSDIDLLVAKASGQFIFAITVIKFIDDPRQDPKERLQSILRLSCTGNETTFALLDALYLFILRSVADTGKVLEILTLIMSSLLYGRASSIDLLEELMGFNIRRVLVDMHALVFVPSTTDKTRLHIHHASLHDFLMDQSRSHEFYINASQGHASLCIRWLKVIGTHPPSRKLRNDVAVALFLHHYSEARSPAHNQIVDALAHFDLRASLEEISDFDRDLYLPSWSSFFDPDPEGEIFIRLQEDFLAFIFNRIVQYPPSLWTYIPVLLCESTSGQEICPIVFHGVCKSPEEFEALIFADERLLDLLGSKIRNGDCLTHLIRHQKSTASKYFVANYEEERIKMLKVILSVICSKPEERNHQMVFSFGSPFANNSHETMLMKIWNPSLDTIVELLRSASNCEVLDPYFSKFLLERVVQFRNDIAPMPGRRKIAEASIEYIQKCGVPFLVHAHEPGTNECAICMCVGAIVVENTPREWPPFPQTINPMVLRQRRF